MTSKIVAFINKVIREEHGSTVSLTSTVGDADLDSYGYTVLFLELDDAYQCFNNDWFESVDLLSLTIQDLVDRVIDASKII